MKKISTSCFFLLIVINLFGQTPNSWTEKAAFGLSQSASSFPSARHNAVSFSINGKGYYGTGDDYNSIIFGDFWEYDPATNVWSQKANFGGGLRSGAAAFVIGNKGYVGTGGDGFQSRDDFWEYDPLNNSWIQKAVFPFGARSEASGFSIGTKGYLIAGMDSAGATADLWEYNNVTNNWTFKSYLPGGVRDNACSFSIGTKGYVGCGKFYNGLTNVFMKDFWEYDPAGNSWLQKADFSGAARGEAVSFVSGGQGFIGLGWNLAGYYTDFWAYDPASNSWISKAAFGGTSRFSSTAFATGTKAYVTGGSDLIIGILNDLWEYDPQINSWTLKSNPALHSRRYGISFSIGNKGYAGLGNYTSYYNDFWEFQPVANIWTQKAAFPGIARVGATSFELMGKGFVCAGMGNNTFLDDLWIYNPVNNVWSQKTSFPGGVRRFAAGFSIGNKGYLGTGQTGPLKKDWWEYDLIKDSWSQRADLPGLERADATGFSIGKYGYIVCGLMNGGQSKELWKFDPDSNKWTQRADLGGVTRYDAAGFSIGDKGYLGTGFGPSANEQNDFWEYSPATNTWTQRAQFPSSPRLGCIAFSISGKGYMGTGFGDTGYKNDFYEYTPVCTTPPADLYVPGNSAICNGDSTFLFVTKGYSYQWKKNGVAISGAVSDYLYTKTSGNYSCQITGSCGTVTTNSVTVTINPLPSATITAGGSTAICSGSSVVLNAPVAANRSYQWKKSGITIAGAVSSGYIATASGTYKVTVTNTNTGCIKTSGSGIVVTVYANPTAIVTPQGPTLFCNGDSVQLKANYNTTYSYQWKLNNSNIAGAISNKYEAKTAGNYKVKETTANGCTAISSAITVSVPCREGEHNLPDGNNIIAAVYPNPSSTDFILKIENGFSENFSVQFYDAIGKEIYPGLEKISESEYRISKLKQGIFSAVVKHQTSIQYLKLIKLQQ